ncbi:trypsin-like serine peptidase [Streptomyces iconiensis]|uniref:Trypsin-like peptidase domain-containing protein n=1 Tax=Streptomyces iconiensis TaxID=1384038 RepID=A0ABT7ABE9_9ACTN|nr:trypsin-like peptidase domain-containing protein [Streptomyces iconiensis]MDJ1138324.1 trypsin-like peptidase domain-containing protein [Streptomyces iconiensis]
MGIKRYRVGAALAGALIGATLGGAGSGPGPGTGAVQETGGDSWPGGSIATVGKLVSFLPNGHTGLCSGAIVDSPNGSVIATAAHCLTSPEEPVRAEEIYFLPGYDGLGQRDRTRIRAEGWRVRGRYQPRGWDVSRPLAEILPDDWAFLTVARKNGRTVQEAADGANRLAFAPEESGEPLAVAGYSASGPYDGERLRYCAGPARLAPPGEYARPNVGSFVLDGCDLTQGASGGPWLRGYHEGRQAGTVVAVVTVGESGKVLGRPFPSRARALFTRAAREGGERAARDGGE